MIPHEIAIPPAATVPPAQAGRLSLAAMLTPGRLALGLGYRCAAAADWSRQGFALRVPAETTTLRVWLRATGHGTAEFTDVELRPVQ